MPPVKKQLPPSSTKADVTVPHLIPNKLIDDGVGGMKILVYGVAKKGKTRLGCTFPKPLLLVGTEDGTKSVSNGRIEKSKLSDKITPVYELKAMGKPTGIDFVRMVHTDQMDELVNKVYAGEYASVVMDTAGGVQELKVKEFLNLKDVPVQKSWGMMGQKEWGIVTGQFKDTMRILLNTADRVGTKVFMVAHERNFAKEDSVGDLITPKVGAAMTPSAADWLHAEADYLGQMFVRAQTVKRKEKVGNTDIEMESRTGKFEYCLRVGEHDMFVTGFRVVPGAVVPDVIVNPTYQRIVDVIHGKGSK